MAYDVHYADTDKYIHILGSLISDYHSSPSGHSFELEEYIEEMLFF